jgi:RNA polymerase-binding transcription factor DksA
MSEKKYYTKEELAEFEAIIDEKLKTAKNDLQQLKETLNGAQNSSGDYGKVGSLDDGTEAFEKEQLTQLTARIQKYIAELENAKRRIKNGTYGYCKDTGKLIPKERLRLVPHTQQTVEAKKRFV